LEDGTFIDVAFLSGIDFIEDGRAVGISDFDADGDLDLVVQNYRARTRLLIHQGFEGGSSEGGSFENGGHNWLQVKLVGTRSHRDAIGARIRVRVGDHVQTRQIVCGSGYLSTQSLTAHFGLAGATEVDEIEIRWPSGQTQSIERVAANQRLRIVESDDTRVAQNRP